MSDQFDRRSVLAGAGTVLLGAAGLRETVALVERQSRRESRIVERRSAQTAFERAAAGDLRGTLELTELQVREESSCRVVAGTVRNASEGSTQTVSVALRTEVEGSVRYAWVELGDLPPQSTRGFERCTALPLESAAEIDHAVAHWTI